MAEKSKRNRYTPAPEVPSELRPLYQAILEVMAGTLTVSEAARRLNLSRNHFQTMMHRGLSGLMQGLTPRTPGKPKAPQQEAQLTRQNEQVLRENERLQRRVEVIDRLLGVASNLLRGRQQRARQSKKRPAKNPTEPASDDGAELRELLTGAKDLMQLGLNIDLAAAVVGVTKATLRRWLSRQRRGESLRKKRGPLGALPLDDDTQTKVRAFVQATRGLAGAESIRHTIPSVSRRQVDRIKKDELRKMEHERLQQTMRITVTAPGVIRGSDAMHVPTRDGSVSLFASADASVPFRTSIAVLERYDGACVAEALERDFQLHGAPLVWRCDRARSHEVLEVHEILKAHKVLLLHGPAYYPCYYGQLERQNREHRAWLRSLGLLGRDDLPVETDRMREVLNSHWRRATLGWRTAADRWMERPVLVVDRDALHDQVRERAELIRRRLDDRPWTHDLPERLAIEQVLAQHGFLRRDRGGWC